MAVYTFQSRVAYDDIDNDLKFTVKGAMRQMQEAAILDSGRSGYSVYDVKSKGRAWILVEWRVRLLDPVKWNDAIEVRTWPRAMDKLTCTRDFLIKGENGQLAALGESVWVLVDIHTGHPVRLTEAVSNEFELVEKQVFNGRRPKPASGTGELASTYQVSCRDIDTNHHMNNRVYPEVAREALPKEARDLEFPEVTVRYHRQLLEGEKVECYYRYQDGTHIIDICEAGPKKRVSATVTFYEN